MGQATPECEALLDREAWSRITHAYGELGYPLVGYQSFVLDERDGIAQDVGVLAEWSGTESDQHLNLLISNTEGMPLNRFHIFLGQRDEPVARAYEAYRPAPALEMRRTQLGGKALDDFQERCGLYTPSPRELVNLRILIADFSGEILLRKFASE